MSFQQLGLSPALLQAVAGKGYEKPTPIQTAVIPAILKGSDVLAKAQTGTGKTAAFVLPLLERLQAAPAVPANRCQVLILAPTRELAIQVHDNACEYNRHGRLKIAVVYGGVKINPQMQRLRSGVNLLVATPGRLLDLYQQNAIRFDQVQTLVLDEADRMLDMGFIRDIRRILELLPAKRQNLLFSATFSPAIRELAKGFTGQMLEVDVAPKETSSHQVEQWVYPVDKANKVDLLVHLIKQRNWHQAIVFSRTKHGANKVATRLNKLGIAAAAVHGNKSQSQRTAALNDFKRGKVAILVATDVAARGLHIDDLPQVVNLDLPNVAEDYVHRIGRTGRAGATGTAVSLVSADEIDQLRAIEQLLGKHLPREEIDGFECSHNLPASLPLRPAVGKKPATGNNRRPATKGQSTAPSRDGQRSGRRRRSAAPAAGKPQNHSNNRQK
ncbi:MAG TPA: DEAD/DEAH box helicase [Pseudomonadales bacterium]